MSEQRENLVLTNDNYYSQEENELYMSVSQFKDFEECELHALAKLSGEYVEKKTPALLVGSYVDAYFSNEMDQFKLENPQIFKKDGTLLKDFEKANEIIAAIEDDPLMMKYLSGKHQQIFTGEINKVPFKVKVDSLLENAIVDQKIMSSIKEKIWKYNEETGRNEQVDFIKAFGYDIQGAVYQEIVRQNLFDQLPFILAPTTKEENPDKALIQIDQDILDERLEYVKSKVQRYNLIKQGKIAPVGCGNCPTCRKLKKVQGIVSYKDLYGKGEENE